MTHHFHYIRTEAAPVKDIGHVLDALWDAELRDFASSPTPEHLFRHLVSVANWLNAGTDWTPEQYVAARDERPDAGWDAARTYQSDEPPLTRSASPTDVTGECEWRYLGDGSRYGGTKPGDPVVVIVGWDRPLDTFFAQVWDVPPHASDHEDGRLLLWAGCDLNEVESVDELARLLAQFTPIPEALRVRLEKDRLGIDLDRRGLNAAERNGEEVCHD